MKKRSILLCSLAGILTLAACTKDPPAKTNSRQENEDCSDTIGCLDGLFCEDGKCRRICVNDNDCSSGYYCFESRCVVGGNNNNNPGSNTDNPGSNTDNPGSNTDNPGDNTDQPTVGREEAQMPAGGVFTPMSATVSNQRYKARIMGGAMQQHVKNDNNSATVHDSTWKAE